MADIILDFTPTYGDGDRRRRRRGKHLTAGEGVQIRSKLQRVGFTNHEINMWIREDIPLRSRVAQNLIYARRRLMGYWMKRGASFKEARQFCVEDRIKSTKDTHPGVSREASEDYLWGLLYVIGDPRDRRITGPKPSWMRTTTVSVS